MSIKLFIQTDKFREGGTGVFRSRLIKSLQKIKDIKLVHDPKKDFDIELAFIRKVYKHKKPYILRVDGCYYVDKKYNNKPIEKAIRGASYVIFQSKFAYKLCERVLRLRPDCKNGKNLKYSIIYNGIDLNYIKSIKPSKNIEPGSFVTCSRWDPNKRPVSTIKGFIKANTGKHLYVIGGIGVGGKNVNLDKLIKSNKYVHLVGEKSNEEVISILKSCDYLIHLCYIDACPNVVIEALSCGLNVLCTNLGGTKELVQSNGYVLKVDKFWKTRYMKKRNVDNLHKNIVAPGIYKLSEIKNKFNRSDLDIDITAKKYVDIIKKVI
jgi:glycosyltransferase involved in cell wall biosynthesis